MVKDASAHAAEDQERREAVETRNQADNLVYSTEKFLKEQGDKVPADKKAKVEDTVAKLKEAVKSGNAGAIKTAMEAVNADMQALSADLYAKARAAGGAKGPAAGAPGGEPPPPAGGAGKAADDVIDADFTEKK